MMALNFRKNNMIKHYKISIIAVSIVLLLILSFVFLSSHFSDKSIDALSISSDGRYVISSDEAERIILWNLKNKTSQIVAKKAHIFSAYFIPETQDYLWQDQKKAIHIQNIQGKLLESFTLPFFVFGQAMTANRQYYIAGDLAEGLHLRTGTTWHTLEKANLNNNNESMETSDVLSATKPYNISINQDKKIIVSADFSVDSWNLETGKKLYDYDGTIGKTFATLSPDGKHVITGDEASRNYVFETQTGKKFFDLYDVESGKNVPEVGSNHGWDPSVLTVKRPFDFISRNGGISRDATLSIKFIDKTHYLRFSTYIPYAILYEVTNPAPLKYFPLGRSPWPAVDYYARNQAIDTSWQSHTLVMGKETEEGILVYQYDPEKQTLTKVWDGHSCALPRLGCVL
jgi:WD40 repeat protein